MQRFKLISAMALALILSLVLAATVAAAPNQNADNGPHGLTAALCGDHVCLNWNPGDDGYSFQRVHSWAGTSLYDRYEGRQKQVGAHDTSARIPLEYLEIEPAERAGEIAVYSFQISGVTVTSEGYISRKYGNHVSVQLPRPVVEPPQPAGPTDLQVERCGDAVCLSWTPGGKFENQIVLGWEGTKVHQRREDLFLDVGSAATARIPLADLNMTKVQYLGYNMDYSFLVVGSSGVIISTDYSNQAIISLPRPIMGAETDPTDLSIERCGENLCLSWTPGTGNYHFQSIRFWKTHDPQDKRYHGGVMVIRPELGEWEFTPGDMNRRPRGDDSVVSYTFHVEAIVGALRHQDYIGYTNTATIEVPAP